MKGELRYSKPCKQVNKVAKTNVKIKAIIVCFFERAKTAWCAHVTVAPEVNKIKVFVNGTV